MLRRMRHSVFVGRNWPVNRTVTAVVPPCAPISAFMSRVSRRILTPCSPSRWKVTTSRLRTVRKCRLPGRRAGTPRRRGTNSRTKWAANCALAIRACVCLKPAKTVWITSPAYRHASSHRTGNGVSRRTTTCLAAMNCHSELRSSRAVCHSHTSNLTRRMPRSWV